MPQNMHEAARISELVGVLQNDPSVIKYEVIVDKAKDVVKVNAQSSDRQTVTKTILGPGLVENIHYDPRGVSSAGRDTSIMKLLDAGLTQQEVASRLGVSQSLVSKVYRSSK
jgi:hypothetical protein